MKKVILLFSFCFALFTSTIQAQEASYNVNGEQYILKEAVKGDLTLLWNTIDGDFRYFVKKGDDIFELKNTKGEDGKFNEEYKEQLRILTGDSSLIPSETKLTLSSLKQLLSIFLLSSSVK